MSDAYSSDEENREHIRRYDMFKPKHTKYCKYLKLKNVSYCTYILRKGPRKGQMCNVVSTSADGLCSAHKRSVLSNNIKKVNFNRLKKTKVYELVRCLDKEAPTVILKVDDDLLRVRLPRDLKPIPKQKPTYLVYSRTLPDGKVFAMWKRRED